MHPNSYLIALWRNETLDQVFVAMSFEPRFQARFDTIVRPAIEAEPIAGRKLRAYRVDNAKTGDSILTDIVANIAHSRLILADVSVVDEGRYTSYPVRNGNVMYEVGIALASRLPSEVLLVRDDKKRFLFDVSSVPHITIDFSEERLAIGLLRAGIADRIQETDLLQDARIKIAAQKLTQDEIRVLEAVSQMTPDKALDLANPNIGGLSIPNARGVAGLLQKQCIRSVAVNAKRGSVFYSMTSFGYALAKAIDQILTKIEPEEPEDRPQGAP